MELYRQNKSMEKGYAEWLYQAWNAAMPDHKTIKVALTTIISTILRGQGLSRLNLVEPDSCGLATLTQAGTEQNGDLSAAPAETLTNDHPSPWTSGNDHLMQL